MKRLTLLVMPLMAISFLANCNKGKTYTVTWLDYNGKELKVDKRVKEGTIPVYEDDTHSTPTREPDDFVYRFKGWDPEVKEAYSNATYTATYESINAKFSAKVNMTEDNQTFSFNQVSTEDEFIIDWGDAAKPSKELSHKYIKKGTYDILIGANSLSNFEFNKSSKKFIQSLNLEKMDITSIDTFAFNGCSNLTSVTLPNNLGSIGANAFKECSKLATITFPDSLTYIGVSAFFGCSSLDGITLPSSVLQIENGAFLGCSKLTSINIPNKVTTIENTFCYCGLKRVTFDSPITLKTIEMGAFFACNNLKEITIPNSVTTIGELVSAGSNGAFQNCTSLETINIPSSVTLIGDRSFAGCTSLGKVDLTAITDEDKIPTCNENAFTSDAEFYVANEEIIQKFTDGKKGWPTNPTRYHVLSK